MFYFMCVNCLCLNFEPFFDIFLEIISNFYKLYAEVLTFHTYFKSIFLRHVTSVTQIDLLLHKLSAQYFKDLVRTLCLFRYICGPPDSPKMHHFLSFFLI